MDRPTAIPLRIGEWCVDPVTGQISRDGEVVRLEGRTMRLLLCLAEHAGEVVSVDDLLDQVWSGVVVTPDSVYQAVASLRRLLRDDARQPAYIATVPRLGYRMVAPVSAWEDPAVASMVASAAPAETSASGVRRRVSWLWGVGAAVALALVAVFLFYSRATSPPANAMASTPQRSVGVLPFLDLTTQEMNEEYFADGMTEELINQLSQIPGLRVPAATSSFNLKGKQQSIAAVAEALGVTYVVDGSVRKSDAMLRIAVRLVRADDGYVVWSETYDRPESDRLQVQEGIASEVSKALRTAIP